MKKTQEILGLPIISISDGMEVGKVKSVIINAEKGAIDYIVVDSGIQILSAKIIATDNILGIGEYALTIESEVSINDISKIPAAIDLLQKNIQVKGTKVLTKKGRLLGEIGDIYIDENECCNITGLEYIADITQKRIRIIPRESVITFGKNLIVVTDDVENTLLDRVTQLGDGDRPAEAEKKNLMNFGITDKVFEDGPVTPNLPSVDPIVAKADELIASDGDNFYKSTGISQAEETLTNAYESFQPGEFQEVKMEEVSLDADTLLEISEPAKVEETVQESPSQSNETAESNAASLFEQRQRQYLNGRKSTKTITDNAGNIIISEGMTINHEIIDTAKNAGKLIELVMNNKA